jgi:hypothetical protein
MFASLHRKSETQRAGKKESIRGVIAKVGE